MNEDGRVRNRAKRFIGSDTFQITTTTGNQAVVIANILTHMRQNHDFPLEAGDLVRLVGKYRVELDIATDASLGDDVQVIQRNAGGTIQYNMMYSEVNQRDFDAGGSFIYAGLLTFFDGTTEAVYFDFIDWAATESHIGKMHIDWYYMDGSGYTGAVSS